jgi:radical SAM superfamily enzyme YgiQ (UPF0313 family)
MKLAILSPQFPFSGRVPLVPPILEYLAALTLREAPDTVVQLIDANQVEITPIDVSADTVAISVMTATAPWAYRFADECRRIGKKVILGGIHPSALPEEAALHADAVVVGEAESVWGRVLADAQRGNMARVYHGERLPLINLPRPIDGKLKGNYQFRAFFTMRGCPYRCTFCSVRTFFGDTIRYRPIDEVVAEVAACAGKLWFNGDDNIWGGDLQRSIDLFNALGQGSNRKWYGFGDLRSIQSEQGAEMLAAAGRSGLFSVWVGWENDESQLGVFKASGKQGGDRVAAVKQMQDAGIDVTLFVVLGGRQDSIDSFKRTLELSERLQVGIHPVLLTPLPGTELYDEYREYLLPGLGWESFTGVNAVFDHPSPEMTKLRREEEYHRLANELFKFERITNRISKISAKGFPTTHIYSMMMQLPMKHALSKAYQEWQLEVQGASPVPEVANTVEAVAATDVENKSRGGIVHSARELFQRGEFLSWLACIVGITVVDVLERYSFASKALLDTLEYLFFSSSFLLVLAFFIINRKRYYRHVDTLINCSMDGKSRKALIARLLIFAILYSGGQYWGYICLVRD